MDELQALRQEIDAVDRELVELFRRRMDVTRRVGEYKAARGMAVLDQARQVCEEQKARARQNLDQAAQLIVEKVVRR